MSRLRLLLGARAGQVVPPDPGDYLPGVITNGLQAVQDLKTTAGDLSGVTLKVPGVDTLPAGWAVYDGNKIGGVSTNPLVGWDLRGFTYYPSGTGARTISDCLFDDASTYANLALSVNDGDDNANCADVAMTNCRFEFTQQGIREGNILNRGILRLNNCWMNNAIRVLISSVDSAGVWDATPQPEVYLTDCYVGKFGQNLGDGDHGEAVHTHHGKLRMTRVFVDGSDGIIVTGTVSAGLTGSVNPQSRVGPSDWAMEDCILLGRSPENGGAQGPYNIQTGDNTEQTMPNNIGSLVNCVLSKGTAAYVSISPSGVLTGTNNRDAYTSAVITDAGLA